MFVKHPIQDSSFMGLGKIAYMLSWSKPYIVRYKYRLGFLFLLVLASVGLSLLQVDYVQRSIDAVIARDWQLLLSILLQFAGVTAVHILRGYVYGHYSKLVEVNMIRDAKERYTRTVLDADMFEIEKESGGRLITLHNEDIPVAIGFIREAYANFLFNPLMAIGGFIYLMHFNWQLSLVVFFPLPFLTLLLNFVSNRASLIYAEIMTSRSDYTNEVRDITQGVETIKAYSMQDHKLEKVRTILGVLFNKQCCYNRVESAALVCIMTVANLPQILTLVFGGTLVLNGEIPVSVLVAYYLLIQRIGTPTIFMFTSLQKVKNAYQSMKRLDTILDIDTEREGGDVFTDTGEPVTVKLESVDFSYDKEHPVLTNISFDLQRGRCVGIAGDSGAGKSTLVNLICGFYPVDSGRVSVFGGDVSEWNLEALRSHIAYVSQDAYILPGTLYDNICYGSGESSSDRVQEAVEKAGLAGIVDNLPDKLDTVLSEGGGNLSGGQRQRVSLARAALKQASLYIFDEPTSSLDPATEKLVLETIQDLGKSTSVIVISHSPDVLKLCDHVYFIKEGEVTAQGTMDEPARGDVLRDFGQSPEGEVR